MDEMTGPGEDSQKQNPEDAAKYLAESFFGLNLSPADVGGEVLFDDYDDNQSPTAPHSNQPQASAGRMEEIQAFASVDSGSSSALSVPNRFEENLDDLIVFGDDDDDDDNVPVRDDEDEEDEVLDPLELLPAPIALPDEELEPLEGPIPEGSVGSSSVLTVVAQARTTPKPRAPKARYFIQAI